MKLVFAYDVVVEQDIHANRVYHNYFDYTVWQRYLNVFDEVTVATRVKQLGDKEKPANTKLSSGERVMFQAVPNLSNPIAQFQNRALARHALKECLLASDALIARLPSETGVVAIQLAKRLGKPWAVEVVGHAWDALWNYGTWQGKVYAPIMTWRTKQLVKRAPFALYVTEHFLQSHYPCRGRTTHCSNVEIPIPAVEQVAKQFTAGSKDVVRIGLVGSMATRYKGIHTALHALASLKDELRFEFRILGEGDPVPWKALCEELGIIDRVHFYSPLPSGTAVFEWLDALDMYMQPSLQEGLPRALIEAMSRGLPAIGSTAGGIPELLPEKWIFPAGDVSALASRLRRMIRETGERSEAARVNYETAQRYAKEALDQRRSDFWQEFRDYALSGVDHSVIRLVSR
ncbi:glycosyltransferase family 4 protein [Paenibacillus sp.]|uniref:glycosyltransferase family 4 protein n=1 Tax=Paenibacillus sp. TaxID=58172 RepID=UPI0034649D7F